MVKRYYEDGTPESIERYENNKLNGEYTDYYPNGRIKQSGFMKDGELNGKIVTYFDYGENLISKKVDYINGKKNGEKISYNDDGKTIESIERYLNDKLEGIAEYYDELGNLILKQKFHEDELVSEENFYAPIFAAPIFFTLSFSKFLLDIR